MDESLSPTYDRFHQLNSIHRCVTNINSQYAAWLDDGQVTFQKLTSQDERLQHLQHQWLRSDSRVVLALSSSRPSTLAVSSSAQALVFDLRTHALRCSIHGIGRTITALSWSELNSDVLALGTVDGSICLWDMRAPERPIRRLRATRGPCKSIAFSAANRHFIACIAERTVSIWDLRQRSLHPACTIQAHGSRPRSFAWHPETSERLIVAGEDGLLSIYDVAKSVQDAETGSMSSSGSDEDSNSMSARLGGDNLTPIWTSKLESAVKQFHFLNDNNFYALAWHGYKAFVCEIRHNASGVSHLYSHDFEDKVDAIHVQIHSGTGVLQSVGPGGTHTSDLPVSVLDQLGGRDGSPGTENLSALARGDDKSIDFDTADSFKTTSIASMKPISIVSQRRAAPGFWKTSNQIQYQRNSRTRQNKSHANSGQSSNERATPPTNAAMASSLELPKDNNSNATASMPFLSPSIPSQRSPNGITPLEDSTLILPPLAVPPFDSSPPPTLPPAMEARDSDDSDDDTFVEALEGSATFLPGGINVPLPKACGALFGHNGQLLTFFPPKPRPSSAQGGAGLPEALTSGRRGQATRVSRLFPAFGNFGPAKQLLDEDLGSDSSGSIDTLTESIEQWPQFAIQYSSFKSQQSWPSKVSPTKAGYDTLSSQPKVVVSVYEINDVSALCAAQRVLAESYRLLRSGSESGTDVCSHNAAIAEKAGVEDTAHIWNLIGLLLDDKVPLELFAGANEDANVLLIARQAKTLMRSDSGVDLTEIAGESTSYGKLRWADDPFGAAWLVRRVLAWAEQRSDIQLLACICAVLTDAQYRSEESSDSRADSFISKLPSYSPEYLKNSSAQPRLPRNRVQRIPVLRTNSLANSSSVYQSPVKLHRSSNTSSRNASQPATPYLDSTFNTPPFSLQSLSRQNTHLSTSGSASPEHHRSSFSAAAKYYALSITDKFASYGTSPPTKKTENSPNANNELSASVPSGSWGKSVSFAMSSTTADTTRGSLLSRSYDEPANDDMYDTDRTVDDGSPPYQPRDLSGTISMIHLNQTMFSDESSGSAKTSLIPRDLEAKSRAWCEYYAEQLRSWSLQMQAAEFEKILGISNASQMSHGLGVVRPKNGSFGTAAKDDSIDRTCTICCTIVHLMETVCPSCHHVSHLSCLEEYITELSDEAEFACPTSCGCWCSELVFAVQEIRQYSPQSKPSFKKKASFTDPTRWRARIEGESW